MKSSLQKKVLYSYNGNTLYSGVCLTTSIYFTDLLHTRLNSFTFIFVSIHDYAHDVCSLVYVAVISTLLCSNEAEDFTSALHYHIQKNKIRGMNLFYNNGWILASLSRKHFHFDSWSTNPSGCHVQEMYLSIHWCWCNSNWWWSMEASWQMFFIRWTLM